MAVRTNIRQQSGLCYWHFKMPKRLASQVGASEAIKKPLKTSSIRQAKKRRDIMQGLIYMMDDMEFNPLESMPELQFIWPDIVAHLNSLQAVELQSGEAEKPKPPEPTTIRDLQARWLAVQNMRLTVSDAKAARNLKNSIATMENAVKSFLEANGGLTDFPIIKLKKGHAANLRDLMLYSQEKSLKTFRAYCTHLTKLWDDAAERDLVMGESPFKGLKVEGAKKETTRLPFTAEQAAAVSRMFDPNSKYFDDWLATNFYLTSGCRREELFNVRRDDIKVTDKGAFILIGEEGKTEAALRVLPIHPTLAPHFISKIETLQGSGFIFTEAQRRFDAGKPKLSDPFGKRFSKRLKEAFPHNNGLCLHSARHFFGTALDHADIDERTAANLAGNSQSDLKRTPMILSRYSTGKNAEQINQAMQKAWATDLMKPLIENLTV